MYIKVVYKATGETFNIYVGKSSTSQVQLLLSGDRDVFEYFLVRPDRKVVNEL